MKFFAELKRRNVYKVAVAYAVVGWLLVPDRDTGLSDSSKFPNWAVQTLDRAAIVDWISDRARHRLGLRADAGRNEANGRCRSCSGSARTKISRLDLCR